MRNDSAHIITTGTQLDQRTKDLFKEYFDNIHSHNRKAIASRDVLIHRLRYIYEREVAHLQEMFGIGARQIQRIL